MTLGKEEILAFNWNEGGHSSIFSQLLHDEDFPTGTVGWPAAPGLLLFYDDDMQDIFILRDLYLKNSSYTLTLHQKIISTPENDTIPPNRIS